MLRTSPELRSRATHKINEENNTYMMMYNRNSLHQPFSIKDKLSNLDFTLLFSILLLGIVSIFAQFSSSGGNFDYYSKSHALRFGVFFILFLVVSFTPIRFWHSALVFYFFLSYCYFFYLLNFMEYSHKVLEGGLIFI